MNPLWNGLKSPLWNSTRQGVWFPLGGSPQAGGGSSAFDPLTLYSGGKKGFWIKPRDWTTLRQSYLGTTAVTTAGDPVGYAGDQSGNATNLVNPAATARPVAATVSGVDCIDIDGVDDMLRTDPVSAGTWTTMDMFIVLYLDAAASVLLIQDNAGKYIGVAQNGSGTTATTSAGSPSYMVNGASVPGGASVTRDQLYDALSFGAWAVIEAHELDMSAWTDLRTGVESGFQVNGKCAELILCESQPSLRASVRTYLGNAVGLTL